jgi:hypothetical protein
MLRYFPLEKTLFFGSGISDPDLQNSLEKHQLFKKLKALL